MQTRYDSSIPFKSKFCSRYSVEISPRPCVTAEQNLNDQRRTTAWSFDGSSGVRISDACLVLARSLPAVKLQLEVLEVCFIFRRARRLCCRSKGAGSLKAGAHEASFWIARVPRIPSWCVVYPWSDAGGVGGGRRRRREKRSREGDRASPVEGRGGRRGTRSLLATSSCTASLAFCSPSVIALYFDPLTS